MLKNKLIDSLIKEPLGGAHSNKEKMYGIVKKEIISNLALLSSIKIEKLVEMRIDKFCNMGAF